MPSNYSLILPENFEKRLLDISISLYSLDGTNSGPALCDLSNLLSDVRFNLPDGRLVHHGFCAINYQDGEQWRFAGVGGKLVLQGEVAQIFRGESEVLENTVFIETVGNPASLAYFLRKQGVVEPVFMYVNERAMMSQSTKLDKIVEANPGLKAEMNSVSRNLLLKEKYLEYLGTFPADPKNLNERLKSQSGYIPQPDKGLDDIFEALWQSPAERSEIIKSYGVHNLIHIGVEAPQTDENEEIWQSLALDTSYDFTELAGARDWLDKKKKAEWQRFRWFIDREFKVSDEELADNFLYKRLYERALAAAALPPENRFFANERILTPDQYALGIAVSVQAPHKEDSGSSEIAVVSWGAIVDKESGTPIDVDSTLDLTGIFNDFEEKIGGLVGRLFGIIAERKRMQVNETHKEELTKLCRLATDISADSGGSYSDKARLLVKSMFEISGPYCGANQSVLFEAGLHGLIVLDKKNMPALNNVTQIAYGDNTIVNKVFGDGKRMIIHDIGEYPGFTRIQGSHGNSVVCYGISVRGRTAYMVYLSDIPRVEEGNIETLVHEAEQVSKILTRLKDISDVENEVTAARELVKVENNAAQTPGLALARAIIPAGSILNPDRSYTKICGTGCSADICLQHGNNIILCDVEGHGLIGIPAYAALNAALKGYTNKTAGYRELISTLKEALAAFNHPLEVSLAGIEYDPGTRSGLLYTLGGIPSPLLVSDGVSREIFSQQDRGEALRADRDLSNISVKAQNFKSGDGILFRTDGSDAILGISALGDTLAYQRADPQATINDLLDALGKNNPCSGFPDDIGYAYIQIQ